MSSRDSTIFEADASSIRRNGSHQYAVSTEQNRTLMYETKQTTIPFPNYLNDCYYDDKKGSYGPQLWKLTHDGDSHFASSVRDMDAYRDEDNGRLFFFERTVFLSGKLGLIPRQFEGNELPLQCVNEEVTYQMVRSHPRQMSKVLLERGFGSLPSSTEMNLRDHVKSISTTAKADTNRIRRASVSVMPFSTYLNLRLGELAHTKLTVELAVRTVKYPKRIAENLLVEIMELDLEARLMGETLVSNRSMDPLYEDYMEFNDLNVPLELRRDQVDDLMPTIEEGEVIEEIRARMMLEWFYNSIMKDKIKFRGKNELGNWANVPIFIGNFCVLTSFAVMENMDPYVDKGMGEVVVGKPFCEVSCVETKRFDGIITIHGEDESVTYQMGQSHPRFKHHTNEQCNKIPPLLKDPILSEIRQWKNGSHAGTLACMRWNSEEKLKKKSNLKTS
ncbi:hypothetical protein Tco_0851885 [Tanacetum coccineum]